MKNVQNQLSVLYDILSEHSEECCGSVAECQQVQRIVKSMIASNSIQDPELKQLLPEIYDYSRQGELVQNLDDHINTNRENLQNWVNSIQVTNLQ
ncbi:YtzH-like family protein [Sediminibacillus massiliensis]|uniref:YtzH-like family protein n=1 Tax=Sediminibacillus massiliensis TaxID=1926277 RepID=UPI0009884EF2|nr:YtzH-like family protein [Sediminibacillus massiliensis]